MTGEISGSQEAKDHHYTPQFYMRRFAVADDAAKIDAIWRHEPKLLRGQRSISGIGYEDELHTLHYPGGQISVERVITEGIETPITQTETWQKVMAGDAIALNTEADRINLYVLMRHLQARNLENLRFMEDEVANIKRFGMPEDYTQTEREMYGFLARDPNRVKPFFLMMASNVRPFLPELNNVNMQVLRSPLRLRTSTQPVLPVPMSINGAPYAPELGPSFQVHWLSLGPHLGIMVSRARGINAAMSCGELPEDTARMLNRLYLMQMIEGISVRYCFANDKDLDTDLVWAGFSTPTRTTKGATYQRLTPKTHNTWHERIWSGQAPRS